MEPCEIFGMIWYTLQIENFMISWKRWLQACNDSFSGTQDPQSVVIVIVEILLAFFETL